MFSSRLPASLTPTPFSVAVETRRRMGPPLLDLTETNPTRVGLEYPHDLLAGLADAQGLHYRPSPFGLDSARSAIADDYGRRGLDVQPGRVILTASTSETYSLLFKLLCNAGDDVLVPQPSYPLFELLTTLEGVRATPYRLDPHSDWRIDRASIEHAIGPRTRVILIVSPNNPTGSMLTRDDRDWLVHLCVAHSVALIVDEVFADYPLAPKPGACSILGESRALWFSLGGLSKSVGLPQLKLGWMVVGGDDALVHDALLRLDLICDTYLSVSTPVQLAAPDLLARGRMIREAITARLRTNLATTRRRLAAAPAVTLLEPEGGWSAVLRVPATESEEQLAMRLLDQHSVLIHPGYFFDFPHEAFLVVSLLPPEDAFDEAISRVITAIEKGPA